MENVSLVELRTFFFGETEGYFALKSPASLDTLTLIYHLQCQPSEDKNHVPSLSGTSA